MVMNVSDLGLLILFALFVQFRVLIIKILRKSCVIERKRMFKMTLT